MNIGIVKRFIEALKGESFSADVFPDFLEAFNAVFRCSISGETLRMVPLFITYALQESRALPQRASSSLRNRPQSRNGKAASREPSSQHPQFSAPDTSSNEVSRTEVGIQMLDLLADILCEPNVDIINKFAKAVTNKVRIPSNRTDRHRIERRPIYFKWLLHLLAERSDPRIIVLATKILARMLVVHGSPYVRAFADRNGGFYVLKIRLREWWSIPAVWINLFAILFAVDPAYIQYSEDFNQFTLSDIFAKTGGKVVYPEVLSVISAMMESGLKSVVRGGPQPSSHDNPHGSSTSLNVDGELYLNSTKLPITDSSKVVRGWTNFDVTNNAEVISTVTRFLADMHLKWPNFRDFAVQSNFVQELLFIIYPVVVTADNVSAETELNSRGSTLNFEGQDVPIEGTTTLSKRIPIIRTNTVPVSSSSNLQRGIPFRRPSSFILVSTEQPPKPAKLHPAVHAPGGEPISLRVGSTIVTTLLKVVTAIFLDQILHRKEFPGFGIFLKVPPGFQEHQAYFESYVLAETMKELSNTFRMQEQVLIEGRVINNIARYVNFMAEAIFEGWFLNGIGILLSFIGSRLEFLQRKDERNKKTVRLCRSAILSMKKTFMRVAILRLSELEDSLSEEETVDFLHEMQYWQNIILADEEESIYFLRLFFFQLYFRITSPNVATRTAAIEFWRILIVQKPEESAIILENAAPPKQKYLAAGFLKLSGLDNETFLVWLDHNRAELNSLFFGSLNKHWEDFVADENKKTEETATVRLSRRRDRLKQWVEEEKIAENHWRKHEGSTSHWRNNVFSAERLRYQRAMQDQQESLAEMALALEKWDRVLKAPCNLFEEETMSKWRLDETEGVSRTRLRVVIDRDTGHGEYQPKRKVSEGPARSRSRADSAAKQGMQHVENLFQEPESIGPGTRQRSDSTSDPSTAQDDEFEIIEDPRNPGGEFEDKNRKVMRTLRTGDVIQHVFNVSRIDGLEALEGLLVVGKSCMYLIDHYFQRSDGEVVSVWQAPADERDMYVRYISGKKTDMKRPRVTAGGKTSRHWQWNDVMLISKRRFLQRDVAIEIFFTDGRSYLLTAMSVDMRNELFSKLTSRSPLLHNPSERLNSEDQWRVESLRNLEDQPQSLGFKLVSVFNAAAATPATRKWMKGEISNFAYLMQINTMAGRTFNDLTQYPVFPWVLADYTSEELDLTNPHSFRDLSKPMGCQTPLRESIFREKYSNLQDMGDQQAYHYGTHYSSSMTVCQYLMRLQPFVKSYLILQGDSFDHADRLFYSIGSTWHSASKDHSNDVRELTPEFFYLPEFLVNINGYKFGERQSSGETVDDVILPPWAKGDPQIFIRKHREALESPYVSMHLHKWIDLIFGYKQQGEAAIESTNVFHPMSYQRSNNLDSLKDPHEVEVNISWIHNFGQTSQQIFHKPHPQRDDNIARRRDLNSILNRLNRSHVPAYEIRDRITTLTLEPNRDRPLASGPFQLPVPPSYDIALHWGFSDGSVRFYSISSSSQIYETKKPLALYENFHIGPPATAAFVDSRTLLTAGSDAVISIWNVNVLSSKSLEVTLRDSLFGHRAPVTVLTASKSLAALLSADTQGRVLLWDLNRIEFVRELDNNGEEIRAAKISAVTGEIVLAVGRLARLFTLNGTLLLEKDVCDAKDNGDYVTSCAWYEGLRGEWVERILLFTGHRNGSVRIWAKNIVRGKWTLDLVRQLSPNQTQHSRSHHGPPESSGKGAAVTCILPTAKVVYTGDDSGRVVSYSLMGVLFLSG
jgi:beige protein homolog 1